MKRFFRAIFVCFLAIVLLACGGRTPQPKSAQSITQHFFKRYSKKHKTSLLGASPVQKVEVHRVTEQSLNLAEVEAFLTLKNGEVARVLLTTKRTPPFGWAVISWEMVDLR